LTAVAVAVGFTAVSGKPGRPGFETFGIAVVVIIYYVFASSER
jgi:hypothetical protein